MKPNLDHTVERIAHSEDYRARTTGLGTTKQGQALVRQYRARLADRIGADRILGRRDKAVWRALKGISDDDLAINLLVAGISVCGSDTLGVNDDGEATFRDTVLWIGRNLCSRQGRETRFRVGAWGTSLLVETLPIFALAADDVLILTEPVHELMDDVLVRAVRGNPFLTPLTVPPQPWTGIRKGGLPAGHWACVPLIREHHRSIEEAARKAIGTGRMQPALDAINTLQSVPFTINEPVLDFLFQAEPPAPGDLSELKVWEMDKSTAAMLTRDGRFWVPLNIDFRGRLYGISHFNFSRADHIRGLFLFADGEPIGGDGLRWLKAHVAARADGNSWSHIKKPSNLDLDGRIAWTDANLGLLREIGEAVLRREAMKFAWALPDDPYQFLAACCELAQALDKGPDFITRLPLTFDATCSGLQHLCGMTRAIEGLYVNLIPGEEPDDFYRRVAYRVWMGASEDVRALMEGPFDRAIVKQPAMSYFYGSRAGGFTRDKKTGRWQPYGMTKQILAALKKRRKNSTKGAKELAHAIHNEIEDMVPRAKAVRDFLEQLAKLCADNGKPLRWPTSSGLSVINEYHPADAKDIETRLNGRRKTTTLVIGDKEGIKRTKAVNSVTANFVHSVDAAHLQFIATAAAKEGIGMVSVHDCFGCLAPRAERFIQVILDQFVHLHERHNLLNEVRESAKRDLPKRVKLPPLPEIGPLEIRDVLKTTRAYK
jgi:DNA-directed RNA polymerase